LYEINKKLEEAKKWQESIKFLNLD
jgi:hypothetical protein